MMSQSTPFLALACVLAACTSIGQAAPKPDESSADISVGAIRWDGWFAGNGWERFLGPKQWHDRLPFYGKALSDDRVEVRSDSQETMDEEIVYAGKAGLKYWAFDYYHPKGWAEADSYNYGLRLYLSSKRRTEINFCLLLQGGWLGPVEDWPKTMAGFAKLFLQPTYQKVAGGRPLLYIFACEAIEPHFGSKQKAREAFERLRRLCMRVKAGNPYVVAQVFAPADGAKYLDWYGFDAIGAYSRPGGCGDHKEYPYSDLANANRDFWDGCKAAERKVVPLVNAGWDGRPRLADPQWAVYYKGSWHAQPTPAELASNLGSALDWVRRNSNAAEARSVLVYAWNETDEGGWLVPTLSEGNARLDAIRSILRPRAHR